MLGDRFGSRWLRGLVAGVSLLLALSVRHAPAGRGRHRARGPHRGAISYAVGAGLITAFMILYVVVAGMRGIAWTDTLQGAFMLITTWVALLWVLAAVGGPGAATEALASNPDTDGFLSLGSDYYTVPWILSTAITIGFGVAMFPQVNQRFFAAGSKTVLKRSFALWPILCVLLFVPSFMLGTWAAGLEVAVPEGANVLPLVLAEYTPTWFAALVIAGAMAAMMSSLGLDAALGVVVLHAGPIARSSSVISPTAGGPAGSRRSRRLRERGVRRQSAQPAGLFELGEAAFSGFAQLALPVLLALYWRKITRRHHRRRSPESAVLHLESLLHVRSGFLRRLDGRHRRDGARPRRHGRRLAAHIAGGRRATRDLLRSAGRGLIRRKLFGCELFERGLLETGTATPKRPARIRAGNGSRPAAPGRRRLASPRRPNRRTQSLAGNGHRRDDRLRTPSDRRRPRAAPFRRRRPGTIAVHRRSADHPPLSTIGLEPAAALEDGGPEAREQFVDTIEDDGIAVGAERASEYIDRPDGAIGHLTVLEVAYPTDSDASVTDDAEAVADDGERADGGDATGETPTTATIDAEAHVAVWPAADAYVMAGRVLPLESPDGADLLAAALDVDPARDREAIVDLFRGLDLEGAADDDGTTAE